MIEVSTEGIFFRNDPLSSTVHAFWTVNDTYKMVLPVDRE